MGTVSVIILTLRLPEPGPKRKDAPCSKVHDAVMSKVADCQLGLPALDNISNSNKYK